MTNLEKIRKMTASELSHELYQADCDTCPCDKYNYKECYADRCNCPEMIEKWLNLECEEK